ncbi:C40 family peptidase [Intrasporangium flavum]|uniref:C40 family peptidase n=1 Tax=Intrasporangium flavum TaxID=1428657 RepID=UPI001A9680BA|nr:C40 family peptidase [Intrasporangium flavum]
MARPRPSRILFVGTLTLAVLAGCGAPGATTPAASPGSPTTATVAPTTPGTPSAGPDASRGRPTASPRPTPSTTPSTTPAPVPALRVGRAAWVAVSVATLWRSPSAPRPVDLPALQAPARVRTWLAAMTLSDRRGLSGRADTQALLGERVVITARRGTWAAVVVPDQPSPLDARGYPGWVPAAQLSAVAPRSTVREATVTASTAWLREDSAAADRVVEVSFGTRLPSLGVTGAWVRVALPGGRVLRARAADVSVVAVGASALPTTGAARVASAEQFVGLPYLWAGTSGFGFDCSGLTHLVLRVHGVRIPRDAGPQSRSGRGVETGALRPGDLLFYAAADSVHHVTMYAGAGLVVHAPHTGAVVEVVPASTPPLAAEFTVARRY